MNEFVNLIAILKEYTDNVAPDEDRSTIMVELPKKFYQDIISKTTKPCFDLVYKGVKDKETYILVFGIVELTKSGD